MDIGEVIGGGFRTIRDHPLAVAVWGLVYLLMFIPMMFVMRLFNPANMATVQVGAVSPASWMAGMMGYFLLLFALMLVVYVVLFAAAQRAVLRPEQRSFFYLRFGMDELRLLALTILFIVVFYVTIFILMFALVALTAVVARGATGLGVLMGFIDFIAAVAFTAFYYMRFGLAFPLTLMRGKIIIGEAWRISRGHFWALFAASLVVLIILFVCWMVVSTLSNGPYFAELARNAGNPVAIQQAEQAQLARQFSFSGLAVLTWVLGAIIGALTVTLWGGAAATAVQQLTFDRKKIADTFA